MIGKKYICFSKDILMASFFCIKSRVYRQLLLRNVYAYQTPAHAVSFNNYAVQVRLKGKYPCWTDLLCQIKNSYNSALFSYIGCLPYSQLHVF